MTISRRGVTLGGISLLAATSGTTVSRAELGPFFGIGQGLEDFTLATDAHVYGYPLVVVATPTFVWPNESNTGVPAGTVLTNYTGPATISKPNTIIDSKLIDKAIEVTTSGVIFRKCRFTSNTNWLLNGDTARNLTVEDCEFNNGVKAILGQGNFTRLNIYNCIIGITLKDGKSTVTNCYIHDLSSHGVPDQHFDGIFISGGQVDCLVQDNLISIPSSGGTSAIFIATRWQGSNIVNTTVNHNRLLGTPSYAMYSEQNDLATISGTKWTNNEVQRGAYGYWAIRGNAVVRTGNKDAFTGADIDNL
jgi:hypothetical protein